MDTPDWFNSESTPDEVRTQMSSCVALSTPGPHVFLLCVPLNKPAKAELQALQAMETIFGPEAVQRHTLVLFTHADQLRASGKAENNVEAYIAGQRRDLLKLVEKCGDRFHVMETGRGWEGRRNVAELLEKVEQTVKEAGGQCYSCPAFQEAENRVRQKQQEIAREKQGKKLERVEDVGPLSSERRALYSYMQPVSEADEEVREDEIEKTRNEAEMSVSTMNIESLPPVTLGTMSPSLLNSTMEMMSTNAKNLSKLLMDSSVWEKVGSGAESVQKMVVDSSMWEKVGATARNLSKAVGNNVPKVVVDGSAWVGSGAKAATESPVWEKVGSGAKLMADHSMRVGAGIGAGAKNLAQSPVWGKVGSGAKSGAKIVADSSVKVGAGIGAGAKKVAQSPVWGKVGTTAKQVPKVVLLGALLGLVLGVFLGGVIGGAVGAAAGSAVSEVGRRKLSNRSTAQNTRSKDADSKGKKSIDAVIKQGNKFLKTE